MDTPSFIRDQVRQAREFLDGTLAEIDAEALHAPVGGALNPIGATYAHLVTGEDGFVQGLLRNEAPLFASTWAGRTGLSELPPAGADWAGWGARVRVDRDALRLYAGAVTAATDRYLAGLTAQALDARVDLTAMGLGEQTLGWVLGSGVLGHVMAHWGEICALNGLRGGRGFPV